MQISGDVAALAKVLGLIQLGITVVIAAIVTLLWGSSYGLAALYGGLCAVLPMVYFAFRLSLRSGMAPAEVAGASFRGQIGKFAMTVVLLWLGVTIFAAQFPALLATYAACLMAYWLHAAGVGFAKH